MTTITGPIIRGGEQSIRQQVVVVASIGHEIPQQVRDALEVSLQYASDGGYQAIHVIIPDLTVWNRWGVNAMRNMAVRRAVVKLHADYLLILDNDVVLRPNTVVELIRSNPSILTPQFDWSAFLTEDQLANGALPPTLMLPFWAKGQGVAQVDWCVASCLMFDRRALLRLGPDIFTTQKMVSIEEYDCLGWVFPGKDVPTYVNTDIVVGLLTPPTERYASESAPVLKPEERRFKFTESQEREERKKLTRWQKAADNTGSG